MYNQYNLPNQLITLVIIDPLLSAQFHATSYVTSLK